MLKVVVVTPERALLDETADSAVLPMYDGELGVLPGRAALIGRLGPGELRIKVGGETKRFFVDGGFAQVAQNAEKQTLVTVLTPKAMPASELSVTAASEARTAADALPNTNAIERSNRERAQARARGMAAVAAKNG